VRAMRCCRRRLAPVQVGPRRGRTGSAVLVAQSSASRPLPGGRRAGPGPASPRRGRRRPEETEGRPSPRGRRAPGPPGRQVTSGSNSSIAAQKPSRNATAPIRSRGISADTARSVRAESGSPRRRDLRAGLGVLVRGCARSADRPVHRLHPSGCPMWEACFPPGGSGSGGPVARPSRRPRRSVRSQAWPPARVRAVRARRRLVRRSGRNVRAASLPGRSRRAFPPSRRAP